MLAAGLSLVAARVWLGRGAALGAAVCPGSRCAALMTLLVGPVLGEPMTHFPLYIVEALLVEAIALFVRRPLPFALASGVCDRHRRVGRGVGLDRCLDGPAVAVRSVPGGRDAGLAMAVAAARVGGWLGARVSADREPSCAPGRAGRARDLRPGRVRAAVDGLEGVRGTVTGSARGTPQDVRVDPPTVPTARSG